MSEGAVGMKLFEIQTEYTTLNIYSVEAESEEEAREIFYSNPITPDHTIVGEKEITKVTFQEDL